MKRRGLLLNALFLLGCTGLCGDGCANLRERLDVNDDDDATWNWRDCDPDDPSIHRKAEEVCDGVDQDCDGVVDEGVQTDFYADEDGDGFGDAGSAVGACEQPEGLLTDDSDCDDTDPTIYPGADEDCTEDIDRNCDGSVGYADGDNDGVPACEDCDDSRDDVFPGADETCDDVDQDCDGQVDEDPVNEATWYLDNDGDGHGGDAIAACDQPEGTLATSTDCDDSDASVHPGADDICDGVDTDCSGDIAEVLVPGDYAALQDALDAGETDICLDAGTHHGDVAIEHDVLIQGVGGSGSTTLAGTGDGPTIDLYATLTLQGVTLQDGNGCIYGYGQDLFVNDVVFDGCWSAASQWATAVSVRGCDTVELTDIEVVNNTVGGSRGVLGLNCDENVVNGALLHDNLFTRLVSFGVVWTLNGDGSTTVSNLSVVDNTFDLEGNLTTASIYASGNDLRVYNLLVADNEMTSVYGQLNAVGPWVKGDSFVTVMENATITNNSWDGPAVRGIGAGAGGRDMVLVNVDVSDNDIDAQAFACLDAEIEVSYTNVRSSGTLPDSECMVGTPSNEDPTYSADYDLLTGSPLIDAGDPSILDADGTTSDIGWTGGPGG